MEVSEYNRRAVEALKAARQIVGDSMAAPFARRLGFDDSTSYRRWEAGAQTVPAWALVAAAEIAKVTVDDLLKSRADRSVLERLDAAESQHERIDQAEARLDRVEQLLEEVLKRLPNPPDQN